MIIVTIPYINEKFVVSQFENYHEEFPWLEYRFDFQSKIVPPIEDFLNETSIITIRNKSQKGVYKIDLKSKIKFYLDMISKYNCLVDLELKNYKEFGIPANNLILSHHDFRNKFLKKDLSSMIERSNSIPSRFLKIAVPVDSYDDLSKLEEIILLSKKPVIFAGLGKLNRLTRLLHKHIGASGTYIGLNDYKVLEDQLTINEARLYNLTKITEKTIISGLVGSGQVYNSLGMRFYNRHFSKKEINSVYLPFITDDFKDFWKWSLKHSKKFKGISVTMPYKKDISKIVSSDLTVANFYDFQERKLHNSDLSAFWEAIFFLNLLKDLNILILGTGGSAETAMLAFKNFTNVSITGRNYNAGEILAKAYKRQFIQPRDLSSYKYNVLINCTPLGMAGENIFAQYSINIPEYVIDLPYRENRTPLIDLCLEKGIKHVDGKLFWEWQAKVQLEELCK